ncbi:hypothetical protein [Xanthobacter pseudotagetidis]|uniref:hypothetical protein n=1 Tax=Xanthobacter pseudotagetidis TaxID=3119911 RepID=UPI0037268370
METLNLTLRWFRFILRQHSKLALVYFFILWGMQSLAAVSLPFFIHFNIQFNKSQMRIFIGSDALYAGLAVFLFLIIHNEVLRGPAGFDRATMGRLGSRAFGYLFDGLLILTFVTLFSAVAGLSIAALLNWILDPKFVGGAISEAFGIAGAILVAVAMTARLTLRLPSRAIGRALPWPDVWRMGRGNTVRLLAGMLVPVISIVMVVVAVVAPVEALSPPAPPARGPVQLVSFRPNEALRTEPAAFQMPVPPSWSEPDVAFAPAMFVSLIWALGGTLQTIILCIFFSIAYGHLEDNLAPERDEWGY